MVVVFKLIAPEWGMNVGGSNSKRLRAYFLSTCRPIVDDEVIE
jgi:hypothetical protein